MAQTIVLSSVPQKVGFLKATVVGVLKDKRPILAKYEIYCDENWVTHRVQVERRIGNDVRDLRLSVESRGVWRSSRQELLDVRGCDDVDLAVTPATNTLPIRRLNLQIGSSESVTAAWVKFALRRLRRIPGTRNLGTKEGRFKRGRVMLRIPGSDLQAYLDDLKFS